MSQLARFLWMTGIITIAMLTGNSVTGNMFAQAQQNSSNMDVKTLREQVWNKVDVKDFQGALNDVETLIQIDPNNADNYMNRGGIKKELGDIQGYIDDLHKAIEINPKDVGIRGNIAVFYFQQKDWENATKEYSGIIDVDPNNATAYLMRGNCQSERGNKQAALEDYAQVVRIEPNQPFGYLLRGRTLAQLGRMGDAKKELEYAAQQQQPDNNRKAFVHKYVGGIYSLFKQTKDARRHLGIALEIYQQLNNPKKVEYLKKEIQDL